MAGSPILSLLALILTAGGLLLNIFIILSGTFINIKPVSLIYFFSAGTSSWTYFSLCTLSGGENTKCGNISPAFGFDPTAQGAMNVPAAITADHTFYFYMARVAWAFFLIASFFAATTLFFGIFACCTRLAGFLSGFNAFLAVASQAVCASLMTAWTVRARQAYQAAGQTADLGKYGYGFTWAAFLCFFLAMIFFCSSGGRKKKSTEDEMEQQHDQHQDQGMQGMQQHDQPHMQRDIPHHEPQHMQQTTQYHDPQHVTHVDPALGGPVQVAPLTGGTVFGAHSKGRESGIKDEYS